MTLWYRKRVTTFADMRSCCRLAPWERWWSNRGDACPANRAPAAWLQEYLATAA